MSEPCRHCGTACADGAEFCCIGCDAVWHALQTGGLGEFYAFGTGSVRPAELAQDAPCAIPDVQVLEDGSVRATVGLGGAHCGGCVWLVEQMPQLVDGVVDARLNLARGRLEIRWVASDLDFVDIAVWLGRFGYTTYLLDEGRGAVQREAERNALVRVGVSWVLAANVMLLSLAFYAGLDTSDGALWGAARWLAMLLSGASMAYGGREFFRRSVATLRARGGLSVDLPVALGLSVGWLYSAWATVAGAGEVWFDSVAVLIAALLTARWLHARGLRVASDAMDRLATIVPRVARRLRDGVVEQVDVGDLRRGELCEVRTGDIVPVDGVVVTGHGALDRSLLTGESRSVPATEGTAVWAGETNVRGAFSVRVDAVGDATRFGALTRFILSDHGEGADIVRLADRLAAWFISAILVGALLTAIWAALYAPAELLPRVVALLVVSCPCALGMATPLALTVAVGRAARAGIFVSGDAVFEQISKVDTLVLDKTGTLTKGKMRIESIEGDRDALRLAAAVERQSMHPIAAAFAIYDGGEAVSDFDETPGHGVRARVDGHEVEVCGGDEGKIVVHVDGVRRASVRLDDAVRDGVEELVERFRARGVELWLASGDHAEIAERVGRAVGIEPSRTRAGLTPEAKQELIAELRASGRVVAMVGDGVNDAAALRAADVGIAMHGGVSLNAIAADVQLGRAGLGPLMELWAYSDHALSAVHRNLAFSALYNVAAITAAMLGLVTPLAAAVAMPLSSVAVVASSLLQRRAAAPVAAPHIELAWEAP